MPTRKKSIARFKLPREVAVFPLPNLILFPKVEIPLFIFEPRYRQMLADTLAGSKLLALSLLKKGWENQKEPCPSHEIVGVGLVKAVVENSDGTSHVLLKGIERVQITNYLQTEPYRIARIRPLPDQVKDSKELLKLTRVLRNLFMKKIRLASEKPNEKVIFPKDLNDPITLSHFISMTMNCNAYLKQDLLETVNVNCRMKHLISMLQEEILPSGTQN